MGDLVRMTARPSRRRRVANGVAAFQRLQRAAFPCNCRLRRSIRSRFFLQTKRSARTPSSAPAAFSSRKPQPGNLHSKSKLAIRRLRGGKSFFAIAPDALSIPAPTRAVNSSARLAFVGAANRAGRRNPRRARPISCTRRLRTRNAVTNSVRFRGSHRLLQGVGQNSRRVFTTISAAADGVEARTSATKIGNS